MQDRVCGIPAPWRALAMGWPAPDFAGLPVAVDGAPYRILGRVMLTWDRTDLERTVVVHEGRCHKSVAGSAAKRACLRRTLEQLIIDKFNVVVIVVEAVGIWRPSTPLAWSSRISSCWTLRGSGSS